MTQETVTVRAEQRFQDWEYGEKRTVPRDKFIEQLIENGRVTVIEDAAPSAVELPAKLVRAQEDVDRARADSAQAQAEYTEAIAAELKKYDAEPESPEPPAPRRRGKA